MVDAGDSKSPAARCVGSSPTLGTMENKPRFAVIFLPAISVSASHHQTMHRIACHVSINKHLAQAHHSCCKNDIFKSPHHFNTQRHWPICNPHLTHKHLQLAFNAACKPHKRHILALYCFLFCCKTTMLIETQDANLIHTIMQQAYAEYRHDASPSA